MYKRAVTSSWLKIKILLSLMTITLFPARLYAASGVDLELDLSFLVIIFLCTILLIIILGHFVLVRSLKRNIEFLKDNHTLTAAALSVPDTVVLEAPAAYENSEISDTVDWLTKLPNRKQLVSYLQHIITNKPETFDKYALMIVNLDFFRSVNNNLGHDIGDKIIVECAERLQALFPEFSYVARMDGDEFAVVLNIYGTDDIDTAAEKVIEGMKKPLNILGQDIYISVSIGIAIFPDQGSNTDELVKNAATAINIVKNSARNNYKIYSSDIAQYSQQKFIIHSELRHALEHNEFILHYQPKIDGKTDKLVGIEALIRWNHPKRGLLYPLDFIPIAEETGIIKYIDEWVLSAACNQLKVWLQEGIDDIRLAVNLSAWQFRDQYLINTVEKVLQETGITPANLELEITETAALENLSFAQSTLTKLMSMGVNISIDDFGTGYSSLNYLKHFPISFLKIDKSFVADMLVDKNTYSIIRAIIEVAHALELKVVAEGVENQEQLDALRDLNCDEIQGYLISKPLPTDDIKKRIQNLP